MKGSSVVATLVSEVRMKMYGCLSVKRKDKEGDDKEASLRWVKEGRVCGKRVRD